MYEGLGAVFTYVENIGYDEFGQRVSERFGSADGGKAEEGGVYSTGEVRIATKRQYEGNRDYSEGEERKPWELWVERAEVVGLIFYGG